MGNTVVKSAVNLVVLQLCGIKALLEITIIFKPLWYCKDS